MKQAIIWGASGHAKVVYPILKKNGYQVIGMIDRNKTVNEFLLLAVHHSIEDFLNSRDMSAEPQNVGFVVAIGGANGRDRMELHNLLEAKQFEPVTIVHQNCWVAETAKIGAGSQILAMAAICEDVKIGMQSIINTNATVDHETVIGNGVHIMPGATIAGCVEINDFVTIGANATILPRLKIGKHAIIGAGAVVTKDVSDGVTVVGIPAKLHGEIYE